MCVCVSLVGLKIPVLGMKFSLTDLLIMPIASHALVNVSFISISSLTVILIVFWYISVKCWQLLNNFTSLKTYSLKYNLNVLSSWVILLQFLFSIEPIAKRTQQ